MSVLRLSLQSCLVHCGRLPLLLVYLQLQYWGENRLSPGRDLHLCEDPNLDRTMRTLLIITLLAAVWTSPVATQGAAQDPARSVLVPLKVRVIVSRYQGEKRLSTDNGRALLRMGIEVPVPSVRAAEPKQGTSRPSRQQVSTIEPWAPISTLRQTSPRVASNRLDLMLEDSAVVVEKTDGSPPTAIAGAPIFRAFRSQNTLLAGIQAQLKSCFLMGRLLTRFPVTRNTAFTIAGGICAIASSPTPSSQ